MTYRPPTQRRAIESENLFLAAFDTLLKEKGFKETTIEDVCLAVEMTKGAFMTRFGSKEQALLVLYGRYCDEAIEAMTTFRSKIAGYPSAAVMFAEMSAKYETLLLKHFSSNRAMHEHFQKKLEVDDATKAIFRECVQLMKDAQQQFLPHSSYTDEGAYAAAQTLVTLDFNYVLKAMPAFPRDAERRHKLVADLLDVAFRR